MICDCENLYYNQITLVIFEVCKRKDIINNNFIISLTYKTLYFTPFLQEAFGGTSWPMGKRGGVSYLGNERKSVGGRHKYTGDT